ncbi:unnamed protein product [Camellia sinensis]
MDVSSKIMSFSHNGPRAVCILSANGGMSNVTLRQAATFGGTATHEENLPYDSVSFGNDLFMRLFDTWWAIRYFVTVWFILLTEVGGSAELNWWVECHISWTRWTCFRWLCCRTSYCCSPCSGGGRGKGKLHHATGKTRTQTSPLAREHLIYGPNPWSYSDLIMGSFIADGGKESKAVNQMEQLSAPSKLSPVGGGGATGATSPPSHGPLSESSGGPGSPLNHSTGAYNNSNPQGMLTMPWR